MKAGIYIGKDSFEQELRFINLLKELSAGGCETYRVVNREELQDNTDMLLSVGGDGTFLSASEIVADRDIPVVGVNLGRMGFLSENSPEELAQPLLSGDYTVENRAMLEVLPQGDVVLPAGCCHALNEMTVHRNGPSMLEVEVCIDGIRLPTYRADGLIVSTSSGSTAYSLSVGGPIVLPEAKVLIISPIAPHNLNMRPLVIPDAARIDLRMCSRDKDFVFSADNRSVILEEGASLSVTVAQFSLKRVRLNRSNFINALTQKLFWGEDVRNIK
jgi:NAD+ kinase